MSLHMGGPLSEQSFNLMKTQFSHLEARITFHIFINIFIFKHLNCTTIPCESDNDYSMCRLSKIQFVILSSVIMFQMTTDLISYSLSTNTYFKLVGLPKYGSVHHSFDVNRLYVNKGLSKSHICRVERGKGKRYLQCLAKVFGPLELCDLLPHFRLQT